MAKWGRTHWTIVSCKNIYFGLSCGGLPVLRHPWDSDQLSLGRTLLYEGKKINGKKSMMLLYYYIIVNITEHQQDFFFKKECSKGSPFSLSSLITSLQTTALRSKISSSPVCRALFLQSVSVCHILSHCIQFLSKLLIVMFGKSTVADKWEWGVSFCKIILFLSQYSICASLMKFKTSPFNPFC